MEVTASPLPQTASGYCKPGELKASFPSFPVSALSLICPGCESRPRAPPPTTAWEGGPRAWKGRGDQVSQKCPKCINQGLGRLRAKMSKRSNLWQTLGLSLSHTAETLQRLYPGAQPALESLPGVIFPNLPWPGGRSDSSGHSPTLFPGDRCRIKRCFRLRRARRSWHFS